jgi:hypothetical protein
MQFGIFTVGDVTPDPTTGRTPTEHERIQAMVTIALKAEEVGLDVFATGEHHNVPFVPSSPTTMLGRIAARTEKLLLSTATTLITTNDPVKIAEDYAMLQHLSGGRVDLMMGCGNTGPVHPWFGKDIRAGIPWRSRITRSCAGCGGRTPSTGPASSVRRCSRSPRRRAPSTVFRRSSGTAPSAARRSPSRPPSTVTAFLPTTLSGPPRTPSAWPGSTASGSPTGSRSGQTVILLRPGDAGEHLIPLFRHPVDDVEGWSHQVADVSSRASDTDDDVVQRGSDLTGQIRCGGLGVRGAGRISRDPVATATGE